jgi:hypothetical protein
MAFGTVEISEIFNEYCKQAHVECRVQGYPNPGDPYRSMKMLVFRNFNNDIVRVVRQNQRKDVLFIPAHGELQFVLGFDEPLPYLDNEKS